jgi:hypothetical protein
LGCRILLPAPSARARCALRFQTPCAACFPRYVLRHPPQTPTAHGAAAVILCGASSTRPIPQPQIGFQDSLAEWSKALVSGASPQGRGFEPHSCQLHDAATNAQFLSELAFEYMILPMPPIRQSSIREVCLAPCKMRRSTSPHNKKGRELTPMHGLPVPPPGGGRRA